MMKFKVMPEGKKIKLKGKERLAALNELSKQRETDWAEHSTKLELIQALIPLGLKAVEDVLLDEVSQLVGARYERGNGQYKRWGHNPGSVFIGGQKNAVKVPRVRDVENNKEVSLESYQELQTPTTINDAIYRQIINGISTRKYEEAAALIPETLGIKKSAISKRFVEMSSKNLKDFVERNLSEHDIVAVFVDGKRFGGNEIIFALGVCITGEKVVLGFIEAATENHEVCKDFISNLVSRGLNIDNEILFIIDGSKGLRKGIKAVLGEKALIQRCQWHKRENVVSYLPDSEKEKFRTKLNRAYSLVSEDQVLKELKRIGMEIKLINESAYASLMEGLEETLTVHRLKVGALLRTSIRTTNPIENVNSLIAQYTDRVDYWKNSNQRQRWVAAALLEVESRLIRLKGFRELRKLRENMKAYRQHLEDKKAA
jgi:transposase-like protein